MRYEIHESAVLPPRAATFLAIAALHVAFAYLFISGLAQSAFKEFIEPMKVVPVPRVLPPVEPPKQVPQPTYRIPTVHLPDPDYPDLPVPEEPSTAPTVEFVSDPAPVRDPPATVVSPEPIVVVGAHRLPNTEGYYPPPLIREGVEGAADVRVCVDANGRLQGSPTIQRSSGHPGIDRAAMNVARDGRYARSTRGGRPVPNCHAFRIIFDVNDR
jgi:periplasmic protein TonB